jgi:hypothetical protein
MDIDSTLADLKAQHDALTEAYQNAKLLGSRKAYAEASDKLTAFRDKYGKVIKALDEVSTTGQTEV